jgi:urea carboxylase
MPITRYDYGGDEYILVIFNEAMDLETNFKILAVRQEIQHRNIPGVIETCPANASYMVHFHPEVIYPDRLIRELKDIEHTVQHSGALRSRLVDIPVLFDDPWTRECAQRFGDRHQDPSVSNLEYLMRINGYASKEAFIAAYCDRPYWISMVGFVPGTAWCYRMVSPDRAIQAPKYVRPRTDTPERAVAHGGVFLCIYPVRGPGGYQMIGMSAVPVYDPEERLPDLRGRYILAEAGDRWKFRPIDMDEYNDIRAKVDARTYRYRIIEQEFRPNLYLQDPDRYLQQLQAEADEADHG